MEMLLPMMLMLVAVNAVPTFKTGETYFTELSVNEEGVEFEEDIIVDDHQIVISIPQHRDVVASTVLMDLEKNISVRYVPSENSCYMEASAILYGNDGQQLEMQDFDNYEANENPVVSISHVWTPGFRIRHEDLPPFMDSLCKNIPIYLLVPKLRSRAKRQTSMATCSAPQQRCSLTIKACHYYPVRDCSERTLEALFGMLADKAYGLVKCDQKLAHVIDQVMCCAPCCEDRATSDPAHPFCDDVWPECGEAEEINFEDAIRISQLNPRVPHTTKLPEPTTTERPQTTTERPQMTTERPLFGIVHDTLNTEQPGSGARKGTDDDDDDDDDSSLRHTTDDYDYENKEPLAE